MAASVRAGTACVRQFLRRDICLSKQPSRQRWKWINRGKPASEAKTYAQRAAELRARDTSKDINIGFQQLTYRPDSNFDTDADKENSSLLAKVEQGWHKTTWPKDIKFIADSYGVYRDLFNHCYFYPQIPLNIFYDCGDGSATPVYTGNIVTPSEVGSAPHVEYDNGPDTLYTLVMAAPDSHLQDNEAQYLHWLVGNIPGDDVVKGEQICNYFPPFPARGTGHHRYVFILYEQTEEIDFSEEKRSDNCVCLKERTFQMAKFYKKYEDHMTPLSLAFFQSEWDESVKNTFWNVLDMPEPSYEFMHPPNYHPKQKQFPHRKPFNLYLDRYRDEKCINEEVLKVKLKNLSPLQPPPPPPKYPNIHMEKFGPTWLKVKKRHMRLREMQWQDLD